MKNQYNEETLRISRIGLKPLVFKVSEFKKLIRNNPSLKLESEIKTFNEVVVSSKKLKEKVLGNKTTSNIVSVGFTSNDLGNEIAHRIKIKGTPSYVKDFNMNITRNEIDTLRFRINFYDLKDGLPNKPINKENIIVTTTIKEGPLKVDLSEYNIVVQDDFVVAIEWLENYGNNADLRFSASFLGSSIFVRHTSQGDWIKNKGVSIGFNVTVKY